MAYWDQTSEAVSLISILWDTGTRHLTQPLASGRKEGHLSSEVFTCPCISNVVVSSGVYVLHYVAQRKMVSSNRKLNHIHDHACHGFGYLHQYLATKVSLYLLLQTAGDNQGAV